MAVIAFAKLDQTISNSVNYGIYSLATTSWGLVNNELGTWGQFLTET